MAKATGGLLAVQLAGRGILYVGRDPYGLPVTEVAPSAGMIDKEKARRLADRVRAPGAVRAEASVDT